MTHAFQYRIRSLLKYRKEIFRLFYHLLLIHEICVFSFEIKGDVGGVRWILNGIYQDHSGLDFSSRVLDT